MIFRIAIFFGSCLLFVLEPMLAKSLLPTFGGSPSTWAACLTAFQLLVLAGYAYAHFLVTRFGVRAQIRIHRTLVLAASLGALRLWNIPANSLVGSLDGAWGILLVVARDVGFPFLLLASTTPLLVRWSSKVAGRPVGSLYALSNAGALVGLLGYPFLVEPRLDVRAQLSVWTVAYFAFAVLVFVGTTRVSATPAEVRVVRPLPSAARLIGWAALAFVPAVVLLAATDHITVDVAATPLLWTVPLALYLVSFIAAFGVAQRSSRVLALLLLTAGALGVGVDAFEQAAAPLGAQVIAPLSLLLGSGLLCHGELARTSPSLDALTPYFFAMATGGALGGVFVADVAPFVFTDYYELELAALATFAGLLALCFSAFTEWTRPERLVLVLGASLAVPLLVGGVYARAEPGTRGGRVVERRRSFFGPLRVVDVDGRRILTHGRIQHGMQLEAPALARVPTAYFGEGTALALSLLRHHPERPRRVGVVGLGAGTIAAYGKAGDVFRFYELDPNVVDVARRDFSFMRDSAARIDVVVGDGRLELAREPPQAFDVLVLDAFSSDSVPVHLLTTEAFRSYARHLASDGLLLANVSNRYLAVDRVVRGSAASTGFAVRILETSTNPAKYVSHVEWAVLARDARDFENLGLSETPFTTSAVAWTDARASVLSILR